MDILIISITIILSISGIIVSVWSIISTRNKYYRDYLKRHGHEKY